MTYPTRISTFEKLGKDESHEKVDEKLYREMIGCLIY